MIVYTFTSKGIIVCLGRCYKGKLSLKKFYFEAYEYCVDQSFRCSVTTREIQINTIEKSESKICCLFKILWKVAETTSINIT